MKILLSAILTIFIISSPVMADQKQEIVVAFNQLIAQEEYPIAYSLFSSGLQNQINMVELMEVYGYFNEHFGKEVSFEKGRIITEEENNPFNLATYEFVSHRDKNIVFAFSLMPEQNKLKIVSLKYFVPEAKLAGVYDGLVQSLKLGW